jgi:hypothetical protein
MKENIKLFLQKYEQKFINTILELSITILSYWLTKRTPKQMLKYKIIKLCVHIMRIIVIYKI